VIEEL